MGFLENHLRKQDISNVFHITKEQGKAYTTVHTAFNEASSARWGININQKKIDEQKLSSVKDVSKPESNFTDGFMVGGLWYKLDERELKSNEIRLKEMAKAAYKNLHDAFSNPLIENHVADEMKELKSNLTGAVNTGDYSKVEDFFDAREKKIKETPGGISYEVVKLNEIEATNPKLPIAQRISVFANTVVLAIGVAKMHIQATLTK